jgi:hypothetical protein
MSDRVKDTCPQAMFQLVHSMRANGYIGGVAIFSKVSHNCGGVSVGKQVARWSGWSALEFLLGD